MNSITPESDQWYGLDFGTSNSVISIRIDGEVRTLSIDKLNNSEIFESAVYFGNGNILFGSEAIHTYLDEIANSNIKTNERDLSEAEYFNLDSAPKTKSRLIRSFKTSLAKPVGYSTRIGDRSYSIEDIVTLYLKEIKMRADALTGKSVDKVVVGRPVQFAGENVDNGLAKTRLQQCLMSAGFKDVRFEFEPVAAAMRYGSEAKGMVFVFDFGGGTLDTSVVNLNKKKVLACGGTALGGDVIDSQLYNEYLAQYFGRNLKYRNNELDYPSWAVDQIIDWSEAAELRNSDFIAFLHSLKFRSSSPKTVEFIEFFLRNNLSYPLRKNLVANKENLSAQRESLFEFDNECNKITETLGRDRFEQRISPFMEIAINLVHETLKQAEIKPDEIDKVVLTGGSSLIPCFQDALKTIFGDKIVVFEPFTAVSKGLAMLELK